MQTPNCISAATVSARSPHPTGPRHQSLTLTASQDNDSDDNLYTITLTATGADYAGVTASANVSVIDDDVTPTMWVVGRSNNHLLKLDFSGSEVSGARVGSATNYGLVTGGTFVNGLTHENSTLYMVDNSSNSTRRLVTLSMTTGVGTPASSSFASSFRPTSVAFLNGVMYMTNNQREHLAYGHPEYRCRIPRGRLWRT